MAATLGNTASRLPLIVILGATGTGKSKLALEIAARFQGEIISADSMQVYRGLDIITNKVTPDELSQAPHHLLGFLDPLSRFTVTDFRNVALPVIERLQEERKVPVVVGGTNYYIEALLWKVLIDGGDGGASDGRLVYERDCEVYGASRNGGSGTQRHCKESGVTASENGGSGPGWRCSGGDGVGHNEFDSVCGSEKVNPGTSSHCRRCASASDEFGSTSDSENQDSGTPRHCEECGVDSASEKGTHSTDTHSECHFSSGTARKNNCGTENHTRNCDVYSASDDKPSEATSATQTPNSGTDTHSKDHQPNSASRKTSDASSATESHQRGCQTNSASEKKRDLSGSDRHSPKRSKVSRETSAADQSKYQSADSEIEVNEGKNVEKNGDSDDRSGNSSSGDGGGGRLTVWQETGERTDVLYGRLKEVDPEMAASYHPNERRKIIRSLQVWEQTGRPHSALLRVQREQEGGSGLGGALRFPHALIFWLTCDQEILLNRLDARVDEMIDRGLLTELLDFHASYNAQRLREGGAADYTKGVFQSIGFKEFHDFLVLSEEERSSEKGRRLYEAGVAAMKLATRQYTKKQLRWIKNRFLSPSDRKVPPLYTLDATDPSCWSARVGGPAQAVVQAVIEGRVPDLLPANPPGGPDSARRNTKTRHECEVCQRVFIGDHIWLAHLKGAKHRKMVRRKAAHQGKDDGNTTTTTTTTTTTATTTTTTTTTATTTTTNGGGGGREER
ncbi:hypothetical protein O3P69_014923 [Scylla paramamosain]